MTSHCMGQASNSMPLLTACEELRSVFLRRLLPEEETPHPNSLGSSLSQILCDIQSYLRHCEASQVEHKLRMAREYLEHTISLVEYESKVNSEEKLLNRYEKLVDSVGQIEELQEAWKSLCSSLRISVQPPRSLRHVRLRALEENMVAAGWCPNHVNMCRSVFGQAGLIYSSYMSRPFQRKHPDCSELQCIAYNVEERRVTKHYEPDCECAFTKSRAEDIRHFILEGDIPLARVERNSNGQLCVQIIPFQPLGHFIAVSHVWSHGLANASDNSLPQCQLERIYRFVSNISDPPHLFWIDTLCVPREPFYLRRTAIQGIRRIYEEASKVLVLDEELLSCSLHSLAYEARLMMINLSGWMRRLWTLHEHIRARMLYFQFTDGVCSDRELLEEYNQEVHDHQQRGIPFHNVVASRAVTLLANASMLKHETNGFKRMARMWYLLRWRHLSWPEDETILMTNMLGLSPADVNRLLKTPKRHRMQRFMTLFEEFPAELLFLQVPKLKHHGWKWAPASWLHCMDHLSEQTIVTAGNETISTNSKLGLLVNCPCIIMTSRDAMMFANGRQSFIFLKNTGTWLRVRGYASNRYLTRRRPWPYHEFAICLENARGQHEVRGALVAAPIPTHLRRTRLPVRAQFLRNVIVYPVSDGPSGIGKHSDTEHGVRSHDILHGTYEVKPRAWCIQ